jgi:hypothetical protein
LVSDERGVTHSFVAPGWVPQHAESSLRGVGQFDI